MSDRARFRAPGLTTFLIVGLFGIAGQVARAETVSRTEFIDAFLALSRLPNSPTDAQIERVSRRLANIDAIEADAGAGVTTIPFDGPREARRLRAAIRRKGDERDETVTDANYRAMAYLALTDVAERPDASDPGAQAKAILARPEFQKDADDKTKNQWEKWIDSALRTLARWLDRREKTEEPSPATLSRLTAVAKFVQFLLYAGGAFAAILGLYKLFESLRRSGAFKKKTAKSSPATVEAPDLIAVEIADPLGAARDAAGNGDFRQAVRLGYVACLRRLRDARLLELLPYLTNGEYQAVVESRDPASAQTLAPATRLFDRVWYGLKTASATDFERVVAIHDSLPPAFVAPETRL